MTTAYAATATVTASGGVHEVDARRSWHQSSTGYSARSVFLLAGIHGWQQMTLGHSVFTDRERLTGLLATRYRLLLPIPLHRSISGARYFVSDEEIYCWGEGESFDEAREDYEANLIETYEDLVGSREPLSTLAADRLEAIRRYLTAA